MRILAVSTSTQLIAPNRRPSLGELYAKQTSCYFCKFEGKVACM